MIVYHGMKQHAYEVNMTCKNSGLEEQQSKNQYSAYTGKLWFKFSLVTNWYFFCSVEW